MEAKEEKEGVTLWKGVAEKWEETLAKYSNLVFRV